MKPTPEERFRFVLDLATLLIIVVAAGAFIWGLVSLY